jgi:hypothetical protein
MRQRCGSEAFETVAAPAINLAGLEGIRNLGFSEFFR